MRHDYGSYLLKVCVFSLYIVEFCRPQKIAWFFVSGRKPKSPIWALNTKITLKRCLFSSVLREPMGITIASYKYLRKSPCETNWCSVRSIFDLLQLPSTIYRNFAVFACAIHTCWRTSGFLRAKFFSHVARAQVIVLPSVFGVVFGGAGKSKGWLNLWRVRQS